MIILTEFISSCSLIESDFGSFFSIAWDYLDGASLKGKQSPDQEIAATTCGCLAMTLKRASQPFATTFGRRTSDSPLLLTTHYHYLLIINLHTPTHSRSRPTHTRRHFPKQPAYPPVGLYPTSYPGSSSGWRS